MARPKKEKILKPVHPNAGIEAAYRRRLVALVDEMSNSFIYWLLAKYRANEPAIAIAMDSERQTWWSVHHDTAYTSKEFDENCAGAREEPHRGTPRTTIIAMDATPAAEMQKAIDELATRWRERFSEGSEALARHFATQAFRRSDAGLKKILRDAGISVEFKMTRPMRDIFLATVEQNVQLITSIPEEYLTQVQGAVMRSVQSGRDLGSLTKELEARHGVTRRRAALIARNQNNMATAAMTRARQAEVGIQEAIWLHSHGGKEPRKTHLANSGNRYNVQEGWFDSDPKVNRRIWPGELINCFPASTSIQLADFVEKAYRRHYRGQLAEIVTASGKTMRATPNHPILTTRGWCPIGSLNEGDEVIELREDGIDVSVSKDDKDQSQITIAQVFDAVCQAGSRRSEISLRAQFHGDGADGNVDIVSATRPLRFGRETSCLQSTQKFMLAEASHTRFNGSFVKHFAVGCLRAAASLICGLSQAFAPSNTFALHPHRVRGALAAHTAAGGFDHFGNGSPVVAAFDGKAQYAGSALMLPTKASRIVSHRQVFFEGHVFNLQTQSGWYVADGIISHNCRCVSRAVVKGFS